MKPGAFKSRWPWAAVIALAVLYGANWMFTPEVISVTKLESFFRPKGKLQFDSNKWKQKQPSSWGERYEMVDDLLRKQLRPGLSRQQVDDLLGKPDVDAPRKGVGPGMQEYASRTFQARCLPEFKCALFVRPKVEADIAETETWYAERQEQRRRSQKS
jgi:hypothetical protein